MGSLGRRSGKLVFDSFRSRSWMIMPKTQFFPSDKRFSQFEHLLVPTWNRAKFHIEISSHSLVSQRPGLQGRANKNLLNPFLSEARRFYCLDHYNTSRKHRKSRVLRVLGWSLGVGLLMVTCFSAVVVKLSNDLIEGVPYHRRTRLIIFRGPLARNLSERMFKKRKESLEGRILPDAHHECIRVRRIAQNILDAYKIEVQQPGSRLSTAPLLDGLDWEVLVVSGSENAMFYDCGKIILFDWMFEHITSESEIAFLIAREIGHIGARHFAEGLTLAFYEKYLIPILKDAKAKPVLNQIGIWDKIMAGFYSGASTCVQHHLVEADYIGMHLSALAGYDPRVAPKLLEKMDEFWTHNSKYVPTPKTRAEILSDPEVMEKPASIYLRGCLKGS